MSNKSKQFRNMQEKLEKNQTNLTFQGHIIASKFSLDEKKSKKDSLKRISKIVLAYVIREKEFVSTYFTQFRQFGKCCWVIFQLCPFYSS